MFGVQSLFLFNQLRGLRKFDTKGNVVNQAELLANLGFKPGVWVTRPKDKKVAEVVSLDQEVVTLKLHSDDEEGSLVTAKSGTFNKEWKVYKAPKPQEQVDVKDLLPDKSQEFIHMLVRLQVVSAMHQQWLKKVHDVSIWKNPKEVRVNRAYGVNKLIIGCATPNIKVSSESDIPNGYLIGKFEDKNVHAIGATTKEFVNPFFLIPSSSDLDQCNCEIVPGKGKQKVTRETCPMELLPYIRNTVDLEKGDSLVLYRDEAPKSVEELQPVKKQRTA